MDITIGSGKLRQCYTIPAKETMDKETRERIAFNVKSICLNLGIINTLR